MAPSLSLAKAWLPAVNSTELAKIKASAFVALDLLRMVILLQLVVVKWKLLLEHDQSRKKRPVNMRLKNLNSMRKNGF